MADKLVNTKEAARILGVSTAFLQRDRSEDTEIPYVRVGSRAVRYRLRDLAEYIDDRQIRDSDTYDQDSDDYESAYDDWD